MFTESVIRQNKNSNLELSNLILKDFAYISQGKLQHIISHCKV